MSNLNQMTMLAQDNGAAEAAGGAAAAVIFLLYFVMIGAVIAGMWTTFAKAGKPGWAAIVPIYNIIVLLEIAGRPTWWVVLFLIPCVSIVMLIITEIDLARKFGKGAGFGLGLAFFPFICFPMLGFGSAQYNANA